MNAEVRRLNAVLEPLRLELPDAALRRLRLRLGRALSTGEALEVGLAYGVDPDELGRLVEYWRNDFELERQSLAEPRCFCLSSADDDELCFTHARSPEAWAMPLLLLHGYSGQLLEFRAIVPALCDPRAHGATPGVAFHVVCPSLPGFGWSAPAPDLRAMAERCALLMKQLGYSRYAVHGSDLGACVALELAALDAEHVVGVHVTSVPAYPDEDPFELSLLTGPEKSQLSELTWLRERLAFLLPESPVEALALAVSGLAEDSSGWLQPLLTQLTLTWAVGTPHAANDVQRRQRFAAARPSTAPTAVHAFPCDAPSLRRFAERGHRVVEWHEHERGGAMPALEQPGLLLRSLREFFERLS
jgi:pimeloyl-ACP methyl ester carboxylesterase